MAITPAATKTWKIVGATAVLAGFGVGGVWALTADAGRSAPDRIDLRDTRSSVTVTAPAALVGDEVEVRPGGDTGSASSPLRQEGPASIVSANSLASTNTPPGRSSAASPASPGTTVSPTTTNTPAGVASADSPAPAPAPAPAPKAAPAPAPAPRPAASPVSVASVASAQSAD